MCGKVKISCLYMYKRQSRHGLGDMQFIISHGLFWTIEMKHNLKTMGLMQSRQNLPSYHFSEIIQMCRESY